MSCIFQPIVHQVEPVRGWLLNKILLLLTKLDPRCWVLPATPPPLAISPPILPRQADGMQIFQKWVVRVGGGEGVWGRGGGGEKILLSRRRWEQVVLQQRRGRRWWHWLDNCLRHHHWLCHRLYGPLWQPFSWQFNVVKHQLYTFETRCILIDGINLHISATYARNTKCDVIVYLGIFFRRFCRQHVPSIWKVPICWPLIPPQLISKVEGLGNGKGGSLSLQTTDVFKQTGEIDIRLVNLVSYHLSFVSEESVAGSAVVLAAKDGKDAVVGRVRRAVRDAGWTEEWGELIGASLLCDNRQWLSTRQTCQWASREGTGAPLVRGQSPQQGWQSPVIVEQFNHRIVISCNFYSL